ncbi:MAG: hypothetical protein B7Z80_17055 [Rhodospirillales bacterium 20-64-7]|nr:MAG: hypothetical protein B7Z80_17055 [Rhodospirillales bacterium 20-64-7]HQT79182.1 FkbM family methyltransferase [Rhodopila sp.]
MIFQKTLRTLQHYLPGGRNGREALSRIVRRVRGIVHDPDLAALRLFPPDWLLLDVGANYGQSASSMRLAQPRARIISYEPNTELAARITALFHNDPAIEVRPFGLSDRAGLFTLYIPYYGNFAYPGLASLNEDEARSWLSPETLFFFKASRVRITPIQCRVITLDSEQLAPSFIKIDVQGAEYEMLQGSRQTLQRHQPVLLIESPGRDERIGRLLESLGYREFAYEGDRFLQKKSEGTNSFFLTDAKQAMLDALHPGLFVNRMAIAEA